MARPILRVQGLWKSFPGLDHEGPLAVLGGIELAVQEGEFLSIMGPSGCGKTTFLYLLNGLLEPSAGRIVCDRQIQSLVFQKPTLLPWRTALDNAAFSLECQGRPIREARARAMPLLETLGLGGFLHYYPHQLSEGMKQRVSLARALVAEPRVLLLDEPFSSLDLPTRRALQDDLVDVWRQKGLTIIFVSHLVEEVAYLSDRVVFLSGRPTRVRRIVDVNLPRPRGAGSLGRRRLLEISESFKALMASERA